MAVYFELEICVGASEAGADAILAHMREGLGSLLIPTLTRKRSEEDWRDEAGDDAPDAWWIGLVPRGMGYGVPADLGHFIESDDERREVVTALYDRLRSAPPFLAAFCGFEVGEAITERDAPDEIVFLDGVWFNEVGLGTSGTVLPEAWAAKLLSPAEREGLAPFRAGQLWRPPTDDLIRLGPAP